MDAIKTLKCFAPRLANSEFNPGAAKCFLSHHCQIRNVLLVSSVFPEKLLPASKEREKAFKGY